MNVNLGHTPNIVIPATRGIKNWTLAITSNPYKFTMEYGKQITFIVFVLLNIVVAEPIIISGEMVPSLLGSNLKNIRVLDIKLQAIPFQIDEITDAGEYICDKGIEPNNSLSNGVLDKLDQIVFLREDACCKDQSTLRRDTLPRCEVVSIGQAQDKFSVVITDNSSFELSKLQYMHYRSQNEYLETPWYFAQFRKNRFHFVNAGVIDTERNKKISLTKELRIQLELKALWGLIPISYNEENLVCTVNRYKVGPIRVIKRGDFHLNLGLGLKGSKAVVTQICYPSMVSVPVSIHIPVRLKTLFSDAFVEMTPVANDDALGYSFQFQGKNGFKIGAAAPVDTFVKFSIGSKWYSFDNGIRGYGWMINTTINEKFLDQSGFVFKCPSTRKGGLAHSGLKLEVNDVPKGRYIITNWVLFARDSMKTIAFDHSYLSNPALITCLSTGKKFNNLLLIQQ